MNIFREIDAFYGDEQKGRGDPLHSIFRLAGQIRRELGPKGYLLDNYLDLVLQGLNMVVTGEAVEEGTEAAYQFQLKLLSHIVDGTEPEEPHPLFDHVREVYQRYPKIRSFQERRTRLYLLMALAEEELLEQLKATIPELPGAKLLPLVTVPELVNNLVYDKCDAVVLDAAVAQKYGAEVTGVDDLNQTFELLTSGRIDATLNADVSYHDYMRAHPEADIKIACLDPDPTQVAIPMRKGEESAALREAIDNYFEANPHQGILPANPGN